MKDIFKIDTVRLNENKDKIITLDQTRLPSHVEYIELCNKEDVYDAIKKLKVRGAPAIGVAAAFGIYVSCLKIKTKSFDEFCKYFTEIKDYLNSSRPTAVNLFWALDRMEKCLLKNKSTLVSEIIEALLKEAENIMEEDTTMCKKIGEHGASLIKDGMGLLTHCNAGTLATSKYGTALAPVYVAYEQGAKNIKVYCDETRPLLQGARLTAFELNSFGIDTTLICDNMASIVMRNGFIDAVFVGCDRVAGNGDMANKIGTSGVAVLAKFYSIPFYVCAPSSTIDINTKTGDDIEIEIREGSEITDLWYKNKMAPEGIKTYNPAFDITLASLITGYITEKGIFKPEDIKKARDLNESIKHL